MMSPDFFKISVFVLLWVKGQKVFQNGKKFRWAPYLRKHTSYDCHLWYACVKWYYLQAFFHVFKTFISQSFGGVKGQKIGPKWQKVLLPFFSFFNWDSLHARLNSHYEAWSYKKRSTKRITGYRKSVCIERTVKRSLLILDLKPLRS